MHPTLVRAHPEATPDEIATLSEQLDAALDALERTERNLLLAIRQQPVRDLAENLAENAAAFTLSSRDR